MHRVSELPQHFFAAADVNDKLLPLAPPPPASESLLAPAPDFQVDAATVSAMNAGVMGAILGKKEVDIYLGPYEMLPALAVYPAITVGMSSAYLSRYATKNLEAIALIDGTAAAVSTYFSLSYVQTVLQRLDVVLRSDTKAVSSSDVSLRSMIPAEKVKSFMSDMQNARLTTSVAVGVLIGLLSRLLSEKLNCAESKALALALAAALLPTFVYTILFSRIVHSLV